MAKQGSNYDYGCTSVFIGGNIEEFPPLEALSVLWKKGHNFCLHLPILAIPDQAGRGGRQDRKKRAARLCSDAYKKYNIENILCLEIEDVNLAQQSLTSTGSLVDILFVDNQGVLEGDIHHKLIGRPM